MELGHGGTIFIGRGSTSCKTQKGSRIRDELEEYQGMFGNPLIHIGFWVRLLNLVSWDKERDSSHVRSSIIKVGDGED
jgi:hypothetical protein